MATMLDERPTDAGLIVVRRISDPDNQRVIYQYTWGDNPVVFLPKEVFDDRKNDVAKYGNSVFVGPFDCHVVYEDQQGIYIERNVHAPIDSKWELK